MNYRELLKDSFRPSRMVNTEFKLESLFSHFYEYDRVVNEMGSTVFRQTLHLAASGSGSLTEPFSARLTLDDGLLIIGTRRGGVRLSDSRGSWSVTGGKILVYPPKGTFSLHSLVLPWSFHIYLVSGKELGLYMPFLKSAEIFEASSFPRIKIYAERIDSQKDEVNASSLLKMHQFLTDMITPFSINRLSEEEYAVPLLPPYLKSMHDFIQNHSTESFSLSFFENEFGISRYRLCREYSRTFGISPLKDFNRVRIEKAKNMLLTSDLQVQEVSSMTGFENVNHFIHMFSRETGMTPGEFRKKEQAGLL